jgi:hypothetical protein
VKRTRVHALIAGVVIIEIAAATAAVAGASNLPPQCSTKLIALCENAPGGSMACLRTEVAKVKQLCRQALLDGAFPDAIRSPSPQTASDS